MTETVVQAKRVVVVARPQLGRSIEGTLRAAGYEVHRTPDGLNLDALAARLRPHLIIVALDLPWVDVIEVVGLGSKDEASASILLLGDGGSDPRLDGTPRLPLPVEPAVLLATVDGLLAGSERGHGR